MLADSVVFNCTLIVFEKSRSIALALRPHCSTSKVPFGCLECAKLYRTVKVLFWLRYQSILPNDAMALLSLVMGPFSFGSLNFVAKKFTSAGSIRLGLFCLVCVKYCWSQAPK